MSDIPPEWARDRVGECFEAEASGKDNDAAYEILHRAFARYIASKEEPPVDTLLLEARKIAADEYNSQDMLSTAESIRAGHADEWIEVRSVLAALKRGMELAKEQPNG